MNRFYQLLLRVSVSTLAVLAFAASAAVAQEESAIEFGESLTVPVHAPNDSGAYAVINKLPEAIRRSMPFARELDEFVRRAGTSGVFDRDAYLEAYHQAQLDLERAARRPGLKSNDPLSPATSDWTNIGLTSSTGNTTIPSAGCIASIAVDPSNTNVIYAGASGGGVWKSTNAGGNWIPLTDNVLPNLATASVAIDPSTTSNIYVGSGYCYNSDPTYSGSGVYISKDAGGSWSHPSVGSNGSFVKMFVHPTKPNIVFACAFDGTRGVFRSTNSGADWTKVYGASGIVWDMVATTNGGGTVLFFIEGNAGTAENGVYTSVNDGVTWTKVTAFPGINASHIFRSTIATPTHVAGHLFALVTNDSGAYYGSYKSVDYGVSWTPLDVPSTICQPPNSGGQLNLPQGWYDLYLAVSPYSNAHDTLYAGAVEAYYNFNDGSGWQIFSGYSDAVRNVGTHVDHHSFAFDPNNPSIVYEGNDGGLYKSTEAGTLNGSSSSWKYSSTGLITNRFYHLTFDNGGPSVTWAGAQDQGTWRMQNTKDPAMWHGGDGFQPLVARNNSQLVFAENPNGELFRASNYTTSFSQVAGGATLHDQSGWDAPLRMSAIGKPPTTRDNIVYLGRQHLWQSTDGGSSWNSKGPAFSGGSFRYCTAIGLAAFDPNLIYEAGNGANQLQVSTDFGGTWKARTGLTGAEVTSIETTSKDPNMVLVSLRGGAKRAMVSHDKGLTWSDVTGPAGSALPYVSCESIAIDSTDPLNRWYAGTDVGMFITTDAGAHWLIAGSGFGLFPVRDVQISPNGSTIRVATFGRGIWEAQSALIHGIPQGTGAVEFTALSATKQAGTTHLTWTTKGETLGANFLVERSINGDAFTRIGSIAGIGAAVSDYSYEDVATLRGTYLYRIEELDRDGTSHFSNEVELHNGTAQLTSYQCYPNPFAPGDSRELTIPYEIPSRDRVSIDVYSSTGALVRTLVSNATLEGGSYQQIWDGRDASGNLVAPGGYFYTVTADNAGTITSKIDVIR